MGYSLHFVGSPICVLPGVREVTGVCRQNVWRHAFWADRGMSQWRVERTKSCRRRASWGRRRSICCDVWSIRSTGHIRVPSPEGYEEWNDDAAYDVITAMLTREGAGQQFVTSCFALAADDASLERLFLTSIKNFLID